MNILTRLFVKEWFRSLVAAAIALLLLVTVADIINGFLRGKGGERVLLEWALKMPELASKILPVTCLLATLFTFNRLKSHNELVASLAAGFTNARISLIIAACSMVMVLAQFFNAGYLIPYANKVKRQEITKSIESEGRYLTRSSVEGGNFWLKSKNYFATFVAFNKHEKILTDLRLYYFTDDGKPSRIITADSASFLEKSQWRLDKAKVIDNLEGSRFPVVSTVPLLDLEIAENADDFGEFESDLTTLHWFALWNFLTRISQTGINSDEYLLMLHEKLALSLSCLVFALVPLGTLYKPSRRSDSFGKNVAFTLVLTVVFWLLFSASLSYGQSGKLPVSLAAYIIPALFLAHSIWTFWKHRKLAF